MVVGSGVGGMQLGHLRMPGTDDAGGRARSSGGNVSTVMVVAVVMVV